MTRIEVITTSLRASKVAGWPKTVTRNGNATVTESSLLTAWRAVNDALRAVEYPDALYGEFRRLYAAVHAEGEA